MKSAILAATAAVLLATAGSALAQDHHDGDQHDQGQHGQRHHDQGHHDQGHRMAPPPRRFADEHRFREGQLWRGHHLAYREGQWGYYQPHNGAQFFVHINI